MKEQQFELVIENGVVKGCRGKASKVVISENIVQIADSAFENCDFITEVDIRSSELKTIGNCAFKNCKKLKKCDISILKGRIGNSAFWGCKNLEHFDIPKGTVKIGGKAFFNCDSLSFIAIPESVVIIDGKILNNNKTIIVGEENSVAYEYATENSISFRSDYENVLEKAEKIKSFNKTIIVNLFDEKIVCRKSIEVFQKATKFFEDMVLELYGKAISIIPREYGENCNLRSLNRELNNCLCDINDFMNEFGVFSKDEYYKAARIYIDLFNENINDLDNLYKKQAMDSLNEMFESYRKNREEEYAKVTGLGYGVVGSQMDLVMHGIDEMLAYKKQYKKADKAISEKNDIDYKRIVQESSNEISELYSQVSDVIRKTIVTVVAGLLKCTNELFVEHNILDEKALDNYSNKKANEIIEKVKSNEIDTKYGLTIALQFEPNNVEAIRLVLEQDLNKDDYISLIKLACFYDISNEVTQAFISKYSYINLLDIDKKICEDLKKEEKEFLTNTINCKAEKIIEDINVEYIDPYSIDDVSWKMIVEKYEIILPKNKDAFNFSKEDLLSDEGKKLFSEAVAVKRKEKECEDAKQRAIKETENKIEELRAKINSTNEEIEELKAQIIEIKSKISESISTGVGGIFLIVLSIAFFLLMNSGLEFWHYVIGIFIFLFGLILSFTSYCLRPSENEHMSKNEHMRLLTEKETELNNLVQELGELKKRLSVEKQKE